jgi:hypothetical protein
MSNVLIGIIGVILFIGLALAGATFLGPRFQQSTNMSKAAAVVAGMSQMADAAKLRKVSTGRSYPAGSADALIAEGYLKSRPLNPLGDTNSFFDFRDANGTYSGSARYAIAGLDRNNVVHVDTCKEINRQSRVGAADGTPPTLSAGPTFRQGCFYNSGGWGGLPDILLVIRRV